VSYPRSVGQKIFFATTEIDGSTYGNGIIFLFAVHSSGYFRNGIVGNKLDRLGIRCGYKNNAKGQQGDFKHTGYGVYALLERFYAVLIVVLAENLIGITTIVEPLSYGEIRSKQK
jgi:hypothetical protein